MTQMILNPLTAKPEQSVGNIQISVAPQRVRKFGYFPDTSVLHPGDIILVKPCRFSLNAIAIRWAQKLLGFSADDASWSHAALYMGDHAVVEATPGGVRCAHLFHYVGSHYIRVRRDASLTLDQRYKMVIHALTRIRRRYGYLELLNIFLWCIKGGWNSNNHDPSRVPGMICSQLCHEAYFHITKRLVCQIPTAGDTVTPAHLSSTEILTDISIGWVHLE